MSDLAQTAATATATNSATTRARTGTAALPVFPPGRFMVLARDHWQALWQIESENRLNLIAAYLVLLAGTSSNNRLTRWSAQACERYAGIGQPRARLAIKELIEGGLAEPAYGGRRALPQYRLAERADKRSGIFLPMSLVVGPHRDGVSLLSCLREVGDAMVLRALIDLHGLVQPDVTFGMQLTALRQGLATPSRPIAGRDGYTVWELCGDPELVAAGAWHALHEVDAPDEAGAWRPFWRRIDYLLDFGALRFEPWVFDSAAMDAEPLFPIRLPDGGEALAELRHLDELRRRAVQALGGKDDRGIDSKVGDPIHVVRPAHCQPPVLRGVARLCVDAPTPGLQRAMERRRKLIEARCTDYVRLLMHLGVGNTACGSDIRP